MRVCVAQPDMAWEDKKANMILCRRLMEQAEGKCELIVFPELTLTGFSMNADIAEEPDGDTAEFFCGLSREFSCCVIFGMAVKSGGKTYNRLCCADKGIITAYYDKIHPFSYGGECAVYSAGSKAVEVDICGTRTGFTICYDLRFPELYQKLSRTCGCIVCIASWPETRREHWLTLLKARAIENQCYIIGCNRTGTGGGLSYSGDSAVFSPLGTLVAGAGADSELLFAEIETEAAFAARSSFPVKNDRREDIYKEFYL